MPDTLTPKQRSERMSLIRSKNTYPELVVQNLLRSMGLKFRRHARDLPGSPDYVFDKQRKVIFVHGCFWHRHKMCKLGRLPKSRLDFWLKKLEKNMLRDQRNLKKLNRLGWSYRIIWECGLKDRERLQNRLKAFLKRD